MSRWHTLEKVAARAGWTIPPEPVAEAYKYAELDLKEKLPAGRLEEYASRKMQVLSQLSQMSLFSEAEKAMQKEEMQRILYSTMMAAASEHKMKQRFICVESKRMAELIAETSIKGDELPIELPKEIIHFCLPKGLIIDGIEIPPFSFGYMTPMMEQISGKPFVPKTPREDLVIFSYAKRWSIVSTKWILRMAREELGDDPSIRHLKGIMSRILIFSLLWMEARPDIVHPGFPAIFDKVAKELNGLPSFSMIGEPPERKNDPNGWKPSGTQKSPHWRRPHFRHYPLKKDGTRKAGLVEVQGSTVGVKNADTFAD